MQGASTWDGALEVAWRLAAAGELDRGSIEGGDFWAVAAEQRLAPLLYAAAVSGAGMDTVVRWVHGQGIRELDQALLTAGEGANEAYDAVRAFEAQADRTRTSIEATAQRCSAPTVSHASSARPGRARSPPTACSTGPRRSPDR